MECPTVVSYEMDTQHPRPDISCLELLVAAQPAVAWPFSSLVGRPSERSLALAAVLARLLSPSVADEFHKGHQ